MKKQGMLAIMVLGWVLFGQGVAPALAEMQSQVSVDQATCCEPCHVTSNCKSPESPDRVSTVQNSKPSAAGNATDANQ
jgi:hypothetical protein